MSNAIAGQNTAQQLIEKLTGGGSQPQKYWFVNPTSRMNQAELRKAFSGKRKKPNRLHISRKTKRRHKVNAKV